VAFVGVQPICTNTVDTFAPHTASALHRRGCCVTFNEDESSIVAE
jgi:hypothetical protein